MNTEQLEQLIESLIKIRSKKRGMKHKLSITIRIKELREEIKRIEEQGKI